MIISKHSLTMSHYADYEKRRLESDLGYYKREKEQMEQQFDRRRREILDQMRTTEPSMERAQNMVNAMTQLNHEYRWECGRINAKIQDVQQALLNLYQSQK
jgi:hypothetical protein